MLPLVASTMVPPGLRPSSSARRRMFAGEAVLVAAAGVQVLALDVDLDRRRRRVDLVEPHDGRVADGLGDVLEGSLHHGAMRGAVTRRATLGARKRDDSLQGGRVIAQRDGRQHAARCPRRRAGTSEKRSGSCFVQPGTSSMRLRSTPALELRCGRPRGGPRRPCLPRDARRSCGAAAAARTCGATSAPTSKQHAPMHGPIAATSSLPGEAAHSRPARRPPRRRASPRGSPRPPRSRRRDEHRHAVRDAHAHRASGASLRGQDERVRFFARIERVRARRRAPRARRAPASPGERPRIEDAASATADVLCDALRRVARRVSDAKLVSRGARRERVRKSARRRFCASQVIRRSER